MVCVNLSIDVSDVDEGVRFYVQCFGFRETSRPFPTMAVLDADNMIICIHQKDAGTAPAPGSDDVRKYVRHWTPVHADFHVDDFDAMLERIQAEGAIVEHLHRLPAKPAVAFCSDPFGNGFCIIENSAATGI